MVSERSSAFSEPWSLVIYSLFILLSWKFLRASFLLPLFYNFLIKYFGMGLFSCLHLLYWKFKGPFNLEGFTWEIAFFCDNYFPPFSLLFLSEIPITWMLNWCYFYWDHINFVDKIRENRLFYMVDFPILNRICLSIYSIVLSVLSIEFKIFLHFLHIYNNIIPSNFALVFEMESFILLCLLAGYCCM